MRNDILRRFLSRIGQFFPQPAAGIGEDWASRARRDEDRDPAARDYEIYYWCAMPTPWY